MRKQFLTHSAEETIELGRKLAPLLRDSRIVLLRGDLGTGKTTVVKGIAEAFEAAEQEDVTSPTFTLVHEYRGRERNLFHIDLYRIETLRELETLRPQQPHPRGRQSPADRVGKKIRTPSP